MKTNRCYTIAAVVLMLLLGGETIALLNINQRRLALAEQVTEWEQTIQRAEEESEQLNQENSQSRDLLEQIRLEDQKSSEKIKSFEEQLAAAQKDLVNKDLKIADLNKDLIKNQRQIHVQQHFVQR